MNISELPLPRLQLTWEKVEGKERDWICNYEILIPLTEYDIRNEAKLGYLAAPIGGTKVNGSGPISKLDGRLDTPFRDGAHAKWDSAALGMPAYVVYGDMCRQIELTQARMWREYRAAQMA